MAFDVQTLAAAATCAECLNQEQKQNVALYLLNQFVESGGGGGGGSGGVHDLLSTAHLDTLPAAVVRGALIVGNATPKWSELIVGAAGTVLTSDGADALWASPASAGTVTSFSAGNLVPLFTTSVATAATTPALSFSLSTQAANLVFAGPASGAAAGPTFRSLVALDLPATAVVPGTYGSATQVGQFTVDQQGRITAATDVAITYPGGFSGFANPTALVGLAAVNGVATTAMRSDGAPALDQAIVPTWTGTHTFTASATIIGSAANALNAIQIVPPAALGSNMVDLFSDGGPGYNAIRKYFSSPFQVEIASSGSIDFVIDSNGNETGATVKFLTNALRGGVQTTLFTFFDNGTLVCSPTLAGAIQLNPFGVAAGNTSEIRYLELAANGTNYTGFKAPDALAASEMYVLPDAAPAANRFLRAGAVSGGVSTLSWAQASLTADVTGTLPVGSGGTGLTAGTSGGILGFTAATTLASSVLLTTNALILGGGAGATPVPMASLGTTTTVLHGNAAGAPTFGAVVLTTDVSGILPVANGGTATGTAFTAGSVIFAGAAGVYSQDNANFIYDDAANRLTVNQLGIPNTASATVGGVYFGTSRVMHNFGTRNIFFGIDSGNFVTAGEDNVGVGTFSLISNTDGMRNVAIGFNALGLNTTGNDNVAIGYEALALNTSGVFNLALGYKSLRSNTTGVRNTAFGYGALTLNVSGGFNSSIGFQSLGSNVSGVNNIAIGYQSLFTNTASDNVAIGYQAMLLSTTGIENVAIGSLALDSNTSGNDNCAFGASALNTNSTGSNNIAIGAAAGNNVTTGSNNIIIGFNIDSPTATNSNTLTIGNLIFGTGLDAAAVALSSGNIGIGVITPLAKLHVTNSAAATVGCIIKAAAAQSANLTEWQSSAAVANTVINAAGNISIPTTTSTAGIIFQGATRLFHAFGTSNLFIGISSGNFTTSGAGLNVGLGFATLLTNTTGDNNLAIGSQALRLNTSGSSNVALGSSSLIANTTGNSNVALGGLSLFSNTTGGSNMAIGVTSLAFNTTGIQNVAIGVNALRLTVTGDNNVAIGFHSGFGVSTNSFSQNCLIGAFSGLSLTTGSNNTAIGTTAGTLLTTGSNNTLIGLMSGANLTTGSNNIVVGYDIDSPTATNSNTLTIGNLIFGVGLDGVDTTLSSGGVGIRVVAPTARLHLCAGTTAASTAPLKFTSGSLLTTPEAGAVGYNGNHYLTNAALLRFPIGGVLFNYFADASVGGAEADIFSSTLTANTFNGNGDKVVASYGGQFVTIGTESVQLKAKFAGTTIWDSTAIAISTGTTSWRVHVEIIRVSATVIRYTVSLNTTGASGFTYATVGELTGLTLSGTNALALTGTSSGVGSGAGDIVGKMGMVEFKPAA